MNRLLLCIIISLLFSLPGNGQTLISKASAFINLLDKKQHEKAVLPFDTAERYNFHYIPKDDRKGITMNELNDVQKKAAMDLLKTSLSSETVKKVNDIMQLEIVLKVLEKHPADDHYRDPGKYYLTIFGIPSIDAIWGWRFEGHHISFNFSANENKLVAGTPSFLGSNPAIVLEGPQKNKEVLKEETDKGFALLHALSKEELKKAVIDSTAPGDIITAANRQAMIDHPAGIRYTELTAANQQQLLQLLNLYIHRYTKLFADNMINEVKEAGLNNLWFTWAGYTEHTIGKPYYYRIQGPTIIIEYDNTQNNANHIHTVVRDLKNDFGGDELLDHYRSAHQKQ